MTNNFEKVLEYCNVTEDIFVECIQPQRKPAVLKNLDLGDCVYKWKPDYLIEKVGPVAVKIHESNEGKMNFLKKNFTYKTVLFDELIRKCSSDENNFDRNRTYYYLRSLTNERRGKDVANIVKEFPSISNDIKFPDFFSEDKFFSSILRVSSPGIQVWTHYDIMDNMLIQIQGRKRVVLYSPMDASFMYLDGDKSQVVDIDDPDLNKYPKFKLATRYECILEPGDVLFIPALWFHNTLALTYGVGVNVFWKNLEDELYDKNDYYGNKDILPAAKMLQMVMKAISSIRELPDDYKSFYAKRAIINIENELLKTKNKDI